MLCTGALPGAGSSGAQQFPSRPVRVVTAAVGAAGDFVSRMIAPGLSERLDRQVIVDNRGGSAFWILPLLQKVAYDPMRDSAPLTPAATVMKSDMATMGRLINALGISARQSRPVANNELCASIKPVARRKARRALARAGSRSGLYIVDTGRA